MRPELIGYLEDLQKCTTENECGELLLTFFKQMGADGGNIWFAEENDHTKAVNAETTSYSKEMLDFMYNTEEVKEQILPKRVAREYGPIRWGWDIDQYRYQPHTIDYQYSKKAFEEIGLRNALITPVAMPDQLGCSGVSFFSKSDKAAFDHLLKDNGPTLIHAAFMTHFKMQIIRAQLEDAVSLAQYDTDAKHGLERVQMLYEETVWN